MKKDNSRESSLRSQPRPSTLADLGKTRPTGNSLGNPNKMLSISEMIDERYGYKDRGGKTASVANDKIAALTGRSPCLLFRTGVPLVFVKYRANFMGSSRKIDSEDVIVTSDRPKRRKKHTLVEPLASKTFKRQRSTSPAIAPIEIHKAAFQAAFRDKSVQRTELFHALLPYITVADAEEILHRCKRVAAVISESKFE